MEKGGMTLTPPFWTAGFQYPSGGDHGKMPRLIAYCNDLVTVWNLAPSTRDVLRSLLGRHQRPEMAKGKRQPAPSSTPAPINLSPQLTKEEHAENPKVNLADGASLKRALDEAATAVRLLCAQGFLYIQSPQR